MILFSPVISYLELTCSKLFLRSYFFLHPPQNKIKIKRKIINLEMLVGFYFLHTTLSKSCFYKRSGDANFL